jgi:hypothetical protein
MSVLNQLANALGRRDEVPNIELARKLAEKKDKVSIKELVNHISDKNKDIAGDCVKVIYEIAEINPKLVADHSKEFISLLEHKNNRIQWGAMTALGKITSLVPDQIYKALPKIILAAEKGSVITKDHYVNILITLCCITKYSKEVFPLLNEMLLTCPENQFPMYAENAVVIINEENKAAFLKTIKSRLKDIEKESKKKRVEKVIKKLS